MADKENNNQEQNPFEHPIKRNNWWLYIFGGLAFAGIIIWFFVDWSYKDRNRETPEDQIQIEETLQNAQAPALEETLPAVTVDEAAPAADSIKADSVK